MTQLSAFQFEGYKIRKSIFDFENIPTLDDIKIGFSLSGIMRNDENRFYLNLGLHLTNNEKTSNILVESVATYVFEDEIKVDKVEDINEMFYLNSIALLFPHIRAYITALSSLSSNKPLIIPTLNIGPLKNDLINNIKIE